MCLPLHLWWVTLGSRIVSSASKCILITSVTGLSLLIPAAVGLGIFLRGAPTLLSPLPAFTTIPALFLSEWHGLGNAAVILPMLFFLLWNPQLFRGEAKVPKKVLPIIGPSDCIECH